MQCDISGLARPYLQRRSMLVLTEYSDDVLDANTSDFVRAATWNTRWILKE